MSVVPACGQPVPLEYTVRLDAPHTQMVDIEIRVPNVRTDELELALPVWRPGRYAVLDPAGTVREVRARSGDDAELPISKIDKSRWRVITRGATEVRVSYRVYANSLRDRTRHVDDTHAFLSGSSVFMYLPDRRDHPIHVTIEAPADWKIACGLEPHPDRPNTLVAANYDVLADSPLEIGLHEVLKFDVHGVPHEIVIWGEADYDADKMTRDFGKIVESQAQMFGRMPYKRYVFLLHVGAGRGGTEHLNSTIIQTSRVSLEEPAAFRRLLGTVSHEMFHTWNVKQLRPAGIHPYDYQKENYTRLLWVSEGTTSYYGPLTLVRAGLTKPKRYLDRLAGSIDSHRNRPGRMVQSLEDSSYDAWIKFNRSTPDSVNSTVSFYSKGALVSLLLDMEIRRRTENAVSLDDVMRAMFERFPLSGPGFTPDDMVRTIDELTDSEFDGFFTKYVRGTEPLDLENALNVVGLELYLKPGKRRSDDRRGGRDAGGRRGRGERRDADEDDDSSDDEATDGSDDEDESSSKDSKPLKPYIGLNLRDRSGRAVVTGVLSDGPAYRAGLMSDDEVIALNGRRLRAGDLNRRIKKLQPGDVVRLTIFRREKLRTIEVTLDARPNGKWSLRRQESPTDAQKRAYADWLGRPWPGKRPTSQPTATAPSSGN